MSGSPEKKMSEDAQNAKASIGIKKKLTQERLKGLLDYDPETGIFRWKSSRNQFAKKGCIAGYVGQDGYITITLDAIHHRAHRLAFLWVEGYLPENDVDHIDRIRANNKWNNLREVSRTCNNRNCVSRKTSISGITGVIWYDRYSAWQASISIKNKQVYLGRHIDIVKAALARWQAEVRYGFPNCCTTSSAYNFLKNKNRAALQQGRAEF